MNAKELFDKISPEYEKWRDELTSSSASVRFQDYGAVSPKLDLSQEDMYTGRVNEKPMSDLCRQGFKNEKLKDLFNIIYKHQPKLILELGTLCGMSSLYMSAASKNAVIHTIEGAPEVAKIAMSTFTNFSVTGRVNLHVGRFQDVLPDLLPRLKGLDCAMIDGHHNGDATIEYYDMIKNRMTSGGLIIFDDIRWSDGMLKAWEHITDVNPDFEDYGSFGSIVLG